MDFRNFPLIVSQIFFFIIQVIIMVGCVFYFQIIYDNDIAPDKMVKETFLPASCTIVAKELGKRGHLVHTYRSNFLVSYAVNNTPYQSWVTGNGLDQAFYHEKGHQEEILDQFTIGASYPCWYKPDMPQVVALVINHDWMATLPLAIPSIIGLISFFYALRSIFRFFGFLTLKADEKKKHYKP